MKYYIVKSINTDFPREYRIYNNWLFVDKENLIEAIRKDLEQEVLFEPVKLTLQDDWLLINDSPKQWLLVCELELY